jgi:hypothetical protein
MNHCTQLLPFFLKSLSGICFYATMTALLGTSDWPVARASGQLPSPHPAYFTWVSDIVGHFLFGCILLGHDALGFLPTCGHSSVSCAGSSVLPSVHVWVL